MFSKSDSITLGFLIFLCAALTILCNYILARKNKKQLDKIFTIIFILLIFFTITAILQIFCVNIYNVNPIYFDYPAYASICYLPVAFMFMALIFARTKIKFNKIYILFFIIPTLSNLLLWTNDWHHLFYVKYSIDASKIIYGKYFYIHYYYTILLFAISLFILIRYSIKNSGFFSKQAILIFIGVIIPIVTNILAFIEIIPRSAYITPITFGFTVIFFSLAMFKFDLFKVAPIALQRIVDRISDSYIILNEDYEITDYNETFVKTFHITNASKLRGTHFAAFLKEKNLTSSIKEFNKYISKIGDNDKAKSFELYVQKINKFFNIEITSIIVNHQFLGILILFKDITQHIEDMQNLKNNQDLLIEQERLASLGQMIGRNSSQLKNTYLLSKWWIRRII